MKISAIIFKNSLHNYLGTWDHKINIKKLKFSEVELNEEIKFMLTQV